MSFHGALNRRIEGNAHISESWDFPPVSKPFKIIRRIDGLDWQEGELLDLKGHLVGGCGMQWYSPFKGGGAMYTSHLHRASGTILGTKVEGFFGWDPVYLPAGLDWLEAPPNTESEVFWFTLGNEYDDGTIEVGQIGVGVRGWAIAMINNQDGPLVYTTNVTAEVEAKENGFPARFLVNIEGENWEWIADPHGEMHLWAMMGHKLYRTSQGRAQRVDDKRKIRVWSGWTDFFVDSMTRR